MIIKKDYTNYIYLHIKEEPLLHSNIVDFINCAKEYNLKVTTDGTIFLQLAKKQENTQLKQNKKNNYLEDIFNNIKYFSPNTTVIYRLWCLKKHMLDKKFTKFVDKIKNYHKLSPTIVEKIKIERKSQENAIVKYMETEQF